MTDPMTMSRLKAYRRNASAIEDIKAELSGKYVADSISVCTPPSYTPHSTRIDGFLPSGDTLSLLCEQARLEREQRSVEEFIKGIEDYQTRRMFVLKFIKGKTYLQIAMQVESEPPLRSAPPFTKLLIIFSQETLRTGCLLCCVVKSS